MEADGFTVDLLQAISDWQRGGDAKQKSKRGQALKAAATNLPRTFKTAAQCYRQIALDDKAVWQVGTQYKLTDTISAWTEDLDVAKHFKGGVPPVGYQGVIFSVIPSPGEVVINLATLFRDTDFLRILAETTPKISCASCGIGRYGDTQVEVVLEKDSLPLDSIHSWGGYSSHESELTKMYFGRTPSDQELDVFRKLMKASGHECGPYWLSTPEAVQRVSDKLAFHGEKLLNRAKRAW